jgi:hypothetical protein
VRPWLVPALLGVAAQANAQRACEHDFHGAEHAITLHAGGAVSLQRGDATLAPIRLYWFAWYTFNPQTKLFQYPAGTGDLLRML